MEVGGWGRGHRGQLVLTNARVRHTEACIHNLTDQDIPVVRVPEGGGGGDSGVH